MKIALAQINPKVGAIDENLAKMEAIVQQYESKADLIIFSELSLVGYPPLDLLEKQWFLSEVLQAQKQLCVLSKKYPNVGILVGMPLLKEANKKPFNAVLLFEDGEIVCSREKTLLPTYDVFDEWRYFQAAKSNEVFNYKGECLGLSICEDMWGEDVVASLAKQGARLVVNISASPFEVGKESLRKKIVQKHAQKYGLNFVFINQVGGNDELVFDGKSFAVSAQGETVCTLKGFQEDVAVVDFNQSKKQDDAPQPLVESVLDALTLGVRDYFTKCGIGQAVIGLSGGIDSAVTCAVAVRALGAENVLGITMPTSISSSGSVQDSIELAKNLNIECRTIEIEKIRSCYQEIFDQEFKGLSLDTTEENIQARIRGNILMAFSNKLNRFVLTTGNKSELAVGYCTLYGDMCGGLAVISDVPKTMVYELARWINRNEEVIPVSTIEKAPSAELKPDQKDQDTLPPYDLLDQILELYLEKHCSKSEIVAQGYDTETVNWVVSRIIQNEYKRKQAAPGLKMTSKAFGMGRRFPVAAKY